MRRFGLGVGLLAALLVVSLAAGKRMEQLQTPVADHLEQAVSLAAQGAGEAAVTAVQMAKAQWEQGWKFLAAFADHAPMEEVDELFSAAAAYSPDSQEFGACCRQLLQRTAAVLRSQILSWWNLL